MPVRYVDLAGRAQACSTSAPGGPYMRTPFGGRMPSSLNFSGSFIGRTMASISSSTCSAQNLKHVP